MGIKHKFLKGKAAEAYEAAGRYAFDAGVAASAKKLKDHQRMARRRTARPRRTT